MKDVRIDGAGDLRCWNCGGKNFTEKRTTRSKVAVGVGALVTKKKLKCHVCGEYNDTGSAKPYEGPASREYRKQAAADAPTPPAPAAPATWAPDPYGRHEHRWYDGRRWTEQVSDGGVPSIDPV